MAQSSTHFLLCCLLLLCHACRGFFVSFSSLNRGLHRNLALSLSQDDEAVPTFSELGLSPPILAAIDAHPGWDEPTPVQQVAIPRLLKLSSKRRQETDDDIPSPNADNNTQVDAVWCEAPTGSGKTIAYALPLLQNLKYNRDPQEGGCVAALILCPTRELVLQVSSVIENLAKRVGTKRKKNVLALYGGIPLQSQISTLADIIHYGYFLDVLVATPGRLVDVLMYYNMPNATTNNTPQGDAVNRRVVEALDKKNKYESSLGYLEVQDLELHSMGDAGRGSLVNLLGNLQFLVLDEADRLLGTAFEENINTVLNLLPKRVPTWMFSATFPKAIEPRLDHLLTRIGASAPIRIACANSDRVVDETVSSSLKRKLQRSTTTSSASTVQKVGPASTIQLRAIRLRKEDRTTALKRLLDENPEWDRVLVFVGTRSSTGHVAAKLRQVGIKANELHGKLTMDRRLRNLRQLKQGRARVLLATDVAGRGIDITGLSAVVNYDLPRSSVDFVHRIGRTGRAGRHGTAVSFVTADTEAQFNLIEKRHLIQPVAREVLPGLEPNEDKWNQVAEASRVSAVGTVHSSQGLAHDRMFGGIKGHRKSKKDKLREKALEEAKRNAALSEDDDDDDDDDGMM